jgi:hypothetical protein
MTDRVGPERDQPVGCYERRAVVRELPFLAHQLIRQELAELCRCRLLFKERKVICCGPTGARQSRQGCLALPLTASRDSPGLPW